MYSFNKTLRTQGERERRRRIRIRLVSPSKRLGSELPNLYAPTLLVRHLKEIDCVGKLGCGLTSELVLSSIDKIVAACELTVAESVSSTKE